MSNKGISTLLACVLAATLLGSPVAWSAEFSASFKGTDIQEFINTVGKNLNKTIIVDPSVRGKINVRSYDLLNDEQYYQFFLSVLDVYGFSVVTMDNGVLKVLRSNTAKTSGIPVVEPIGGHAVYLDARALLPHIDPLAYPGQSLAVALYEAGGVRGCEIGTVMFGRRPDGTEVPAAMDLVRLAIPRRTYTQSHIDYVIEVCQQVAARADSLRGFRIAVEPPSLRHFTAVFEPLQD